MSVEGQERPIRVCLISMNERMANTLRYFFEGPCKHHCIIVDEAAADLGIVDIDGYQGRQHMDAYRQRHTEQPLILISLQEEQVENTILLRKPLSPKLLMVALEQAKAKVQPRIELAHKIPSTLRQNQTAQAKAPDRTLHSAEKELENPDFALKKRQPVDEQYNQAPLAKAKITKPGTHQAAKCLNEQEAQAYIGSAPDMDINNAQQLTNAQYDPGEFFQRYLREAANNADVNNAIVELKLPCGTILVLPGSHSLLANISDARLRSFCTLPVIDRNLQVSVKKKSPVAGVPEGFAPIHLEPLLWKAAIWASRGRFPQETSLTHPVSLHRWPNMTRLVLFPHAMRIAALWVEQQHSLLETASVLGIPQRYVFSFYSAANALGLASVSQHVPDLAAVPLPPKKNRRHSFLVRILDHMRKTG